MKKGKTAAAGFGTGAQFCHSWPSGEAARGREPNRKRKTSIFCKWVLFPCGAPHLSPGMTARYMN
jgi:hypothetical protein